MKNNMAFTKGNYSAFREVRLLEDAEWGEQWSKSRNRGGATEHGL